MLSLAMTKTTGLWWQAGNDSPAIMPARGRQFPSHASDRHRSWSVSGDAGVFFPADSSGGRTAKPASPPPPLTPPSVASPPPDPTAWWATRSRVGLASRPDNGAPGWGRRPLSSIGIDHQPEDHVVQAGHVAECCDAAQQEQHGGEEEEEPRRRCRTGSGGGGGGRAGGWEALQCRPAVW
jgi:hypothetical protein